MLKTLIIAAVVSAFASSAFAMDCTKVELDKLDGQVKAMTDKPAQDGAMKEMQMAQDAMTKKDMAGCATHMDTVTKATMAK